MLRSLVGSEMCIRDSVEGRVRTSACIDEIVKRLLSSWTARRVGIIIMSEQSDGVVISVVGLNYTLRWSRSEEMNFSVENFEKIDRATGLQLLCCANQVNISNCGWAIFNLLLTDENSFCPLWWLLSCVPYCSILRCILPTALKYSTDLTPADCISARHRRAATASYRCVLWIGTVRCE